MHPRRLAQALASSVAMLVLGASGSVAGAPTTVAAAAPFTTGHAPELVALAPGVQIDPILTAGDVIGGRTNGYQMTGVPDGLGAYRSSASTIELFMNHELDKSDGDVANSRVSHLTLDESGAVVAAGYALDGSEGFTCFCSSSLRQLEGAPWYFTGEECKSGRGGNSIALNAATGRWSRTPQFGRMLHENVVPVPGLDKATFVLSEDGNAGRSQLYEYTAGSFARSIRGRGALRVWVASGHTDRDPSPNDIKKGETLRGRFVKIPQGRNRDVDSLELAAGRRGAFDFVRIEDSEASRTQPGVVYFSDTGAAHNDTFQGRVYQLDLDPADPTKASVQVLLDGDHGDDLTQPDNLATSKDALIIQEDRNYKHSGYDRVLVYSFVDQSLTPVARADPTQHVIDTEGIGNWETSGVISAAKWFGKGWWLLDVEAHDTRVPQPGPSLKVNSRMGEGGQLLKVYIPGT